MDSKVEKTFTSLRRAEPGTLIFDRYKVIKLLGCGVSGSVHHCYDQQIGGRPVAMKVFSPRFLSRPLDRKRISREIRIANRISHDNVVRFYDCFQASGLTAITMEYVAGTNLKELLHMHGRLSIDEAIAAIGQILAGLRAIHEHDIVHRDIKPANILVSEERIYKITDFGLARRTVDDEIDVRSTIAQDFEHTMAAIDDGVTDHRNVVGTPFYLSPEYLTGGKFDERSDIYAVGVLFYEMVTGTRPFAAKSLAELITRKVHPKHPAPKDVIQDCPDALNQMILCAMSLYPEERYQTAAEFLMHVEELRTKQRYPRVNDKAAPEGARRAQSLSLRHRSILTVLVATVTTVVVFILAYYFLFDRGIANYRIIGGEQLEGAVPPVKAGHDERYISPPKRRSPLITSLDDIYGSATE